jgi:hypothetical protein
LRRAVFIVAQAGFVVGEEHLADQVAAAAHPGLVNTLLRCCWTVCAETTRRSAISAVELPCSTRRVTSGARTPEELETLMEDAFMLHDQHALAQLFLQARGTALIQAGRTINVVRRADDGSWRYAISVLHLPPTATPSG